MNPLAALIAVCVLAFAVGALLSAYLARGGGPFAHLVDQPNERSLHQGIIPRTGGLAVLAGGLAGAGLALGLLGGDGQWAWIGAAALLVAAVSFLDDRGGLSPRYRLAAHAGGALLLLIGGLGQSTLSLPGMDLVLPAWLAPVTTLLYVVWMINLYNFMDGMDGFAGGMTAIGFGALALLGWRAGDPAYAVVALGLAAAAAGFLTRNFPPARIFLGDLGSATLGLLAAALSLLGSQRGHFPLWAALLAFSPFIVDATWTLLARLARGERVWQAHRSHHYQRLVLAGWSHRRTVLRAYVLMLGCAASAVGAPALPEREQWWVLGAWAIIYSFVHYRVRLVEHGAGVSAS